MDDHLSLTWGILGDDFSDGMLLWVLVSTDCDLTHCNVHESMCGSAAKADLSNVVWPRQAVLEPGTGGFGGAAARALCRAVCPRWASHS